MGAVRKKKKAAMRPCRLLQVTVGLFGGAGTCWKGHRGRTRTSMGMWVFTAPSTTQPPQSGHGGHHGGMRGDNCSVLGFPPGVSSGGSPWDMLGVLSRHKSSRWRHHSQEQWLCVCPTAPSPPLAFLFLDYIQFRRSGK